MISLVRNSIAGLPRVYWFLWAGMLINRLGNFVVPFLALYLTQERGVTVERAGFVSAMYGFGSFIAAPLGGVLSDRLGRRATMVIGLAGGALCMLHLSLARSPDHIVLAAGLLGLVGDLYRPAVWTAVVDLVPPVDRPRAYNLLFWAINLGFSFASILAGLLAANGFWLLFIGDAATSFLMAVVVLFFVPETRPKEAIRAAHLFAQDASAPFRDGVYLSFVALTFLTGFLFMQHLVALPLDMRAHGLSAKSYGALIAINGILIVLFQPFVYRWVQGKRRGRVLALASLLAGVGFGLTGVSTNAWMYGLSIAIWTMGEIVMSPVTPAVVADLAPIELRGTYQGVQQMAWGAAACLGPVAGSIVMAKASAGVVWTACLIIGLMVAAGHLIIARPRRERLSAIGVLARD